LLAFGGALVGSPAGPAARESGARIGRIVASNVYLLAKPAASVAELTAAMSRLQQPQPIDACCDGAWRVHFAAWLERPVGEDTLELRFYTAPGGDAREASPPAPMFSATVPVEPGSATVFVNDFVVSKDQGFTSKRKYQVALWRTRGLDGGIELATGNFILE